MFHHHHNISTGIVALALAAVAPPQPWRGHTRLTLPNRPTRTRGPSALTRRDECRSRLDPGPRGPSRARIRRARRRQWNRDHPPTAQDRHDLPAQQLPDRRHASGRGPCSAWFWSSSGRASTPSTAAACESVKHPDRIRGGLTNTDRGQGNRSARPRATSRTDRHYSAVSFHVDPTATARVQAIRTALTPPIRQAYSCRSTDAR